MAVPMDTEAWSKLPFPEKLYAVVSDPSSDHLIKWNSDTSFRIVSQSVDEFTEHILPKLCKSNSLCSLIRQLNAYSFQKVGTSKEVVFEHDAFHRTAPRLAAMKRRKAQKRRAADAKDKDPASSAAAMLPPGSSGAASPIADAATPSAHRSATPARADVAGSDTTTRNALIAALGCIQDMAAQLRHLATASSSSSSAAAATAATATATTAATATAATATTTTTTTTTRGYASSSSSGHETPASSSMRVGGIESIHSIQAAAHRTTAGGCAALRRFVDSQMSSLPEHLRRPMPTSDTAPGSGGSAASSGALADLDATERAVSAMITAVATGQLGHHAVLPDEAARRSIADSFRTGLESDSFGMSDSFGGPIQAQSRGEATFFAVADDSLSRLPSSRVSKVAAKHGDDLSDWKPTPSGGTRSVSATPSTSGSGRGMSSASSVVSNASDMVHVMGLPAGDAATAATIALQQVRADSRLSLASVHGGAAHFAAATGEEAMRQAIAMTYPSVPPGSSKGRQPIHLGVEGGNHDIAGDPLGSPFPDDDDDDLLSLNGAEDGLMDPHIV